MMSGASDAPTLTAVIMPKQESLQYLSISSDTYLHWRTLLHSLGLNSDGQLAAFLLQHFEKTSNLQLTQCVKCCGPVVQYCVPCNIYMTQPTTPPLPLTLLPQEGAALPVCEDAILATDTILLDLGDIENEHVLLQDIAMRAENRTDNSGSRQRREVRASPSTSTGRKDGPKTETQTSRLRMLLENPGKGRTEVTTAKPTTLRPQTTARSLLTPTVLKNLKARVQQRSTETAVTPTPCSPEGAEDSTSPATSADSQAVRAPQNESVTSQQSSQTDPAESEAVQRDRQEERQKSPSHQAALQKLTVLLDTSSSLSTGQASSSTSSSVLEKDSECPSLIVSSLKKGDDDCNDVNVVIVELPPPAESMLKGEDQSVSGEERALVCEEASTAVTLQEATEQSLTAGSPVHSTQSVTSAESSQSAAACPPSVSVLDSVARDHSSAKPDLKPASSAVSDTRCQKDVDASADGILMPDLAVEERPQNVPEKPLLGDEEDSDYHCEPLFTTPARHTDHPLNRPSTSSSSSSQRNSASQHTVDTTRTKPKRGKTTTPAWTRHRSSHCRENSDRGSRQGVDLPEKRRKLDGQVVVITEQGSSLPLYSSPPAPQDSHITVPEGRPKRVAAAKASWTWKSVKVKAEAVGDDAEARERNGHENSVNEQTCDAGDDVSDLRDDDRKEEGDARVVINEGDKVDGPVKVEDVDSKVSILLDLDLRKRAAIIAWKQKRLEEKKWRKVYPCTFCSQEFRAACDRTVHVRERHGLRPYSCTECTAAYTKLTYLRAHINQHHAQVKPNVCLLCGRSFARAYDLRVHQQKRCQDRVAVCDLCGVTLKSARFMKAHMRTHNQTDKPFVCQVCGRAFRWSGNLTDHLRIHSGDKPFTCAVCGVKYVQSGSLRRHMERRHNPNRLRPFVCDICGEARFDRHQFDKHMMIHTGEKPCVCSVCGAAFIQINALNDHMKIHTDQDGKPHKCPVCGAAFKILASITRHMNKVHKANTIELSAEIVAEEIVGLQFAATDS